MESKLNINNTIAAVDPIVINIEHPKAEKKPIFSIPFK